MNREKRYKIIAREIDFVDGIMNSHFDDYGEETHRALQEAVEIITALFLSFGGCIEGVKNE